MIIDACILKMISYPPNRLQHLPKPTLDKLLGKWMDGHTI